MALTNANREDWEDVFEQAVALRDVNPWYMMEESELFGIKSLYSDEIAWCYFIGNSGQVFALNIAIGDEGLAAYYKIRDPKLQFYGFGEQLFRFFNQKIIQVEFTNPDELDKQDRLMHKLLKVPTAGNFQHCKIRQWQAGYPSVRPTDKNLPFIADCLEQALVVVQAYEKNEDIIYGPDTNGSPDKILVRSCQEQEDEIVWENKYIERTYPDTTITIDTSNLAEVLKTNLAGIERKDANYYYFMRYIRGSVRQDAKGGPAYRPIFSALLSPRSAYAHPPELFHYKWLRKTFAKRFCRQLCELGYIPEHLIVNTTFTFNLLEPIASLLDIKLEYEPQAKEFLAFEDEMGARL